MAQQAQQAKKTVARKLPPTGEVTVKKTVQKHQRQSVTSEERERMIAKTAYYIAQRRGFQGDKAMSDWLQAELEIDARFAKRH